MSKNPALRPSRVQSSSWLGRGKLPFASPVSPLAFIDLTSKWFLRQFFFKLVKIISRNRPSRFLDNLLPPQYKWIRFLIQFNKMHSTIIVILAVCCWFSVDAAPQDLGSPIRIAQCRALCLDKVNKHLYNKTSPSTTRVTGSFIIFFPPNFHDRRHCFSTRSCWICRFSHTVNIYSREYSAKPKKSTTVIFFLRGKKSSQKLGRK